MKAIHRSLLTLLVAGALALVCSGCGSLGHQGTKTDGPTIQTTESLVYLDSGLKSAIPCEAISAEQLPSGRTRVYARFANKQNRTADCQIKVRFKGADGRVLDETNWMPFLLARREVTPFEHTSLCTGAKDFTVLLREAKN
jgi:hypothetical protein